MSEKEKIQQDRVGRMGKGPIPPLVVEFAIPAILGMLVNGAYQVIDSIFLGQGVGELGLSVITVAAPTMTIIMALSMLIGNGGNALCALRLGEGKRDEAERILANTLTLGIIISVVIAVLMHVPFLIDFVLVFSSATPETLESAKAFIQIISLGCILSIVGGGINNFIRTAGNPNRALLTMLVGAIGCTVFNFLFVIVLNWGVVGSAIATLAGQAMSCVSVLWYFIKTPNVPFRLKFRYMPLVPRLARDILALGLASFAVQMGSAVFLLANNYVLAKYGAISPIGATGALAVNGVVGRIVGFVILPLIGMSIAVQPLLGFNYGAKLWWRVRKTLSVGVIGATGIAVVALVFLLVFARPMVALFGIESGTLQEFTSLCMVLALFTLPIVGGQIVGSNYFQATGQPTKSIILSLTRQILFLVPMLFILPATLPGIIGIDPGLAIFIAGPVSDCMAFITVGIFILVELKKINSRIKEDPVAAGVPQKDPQASATPAGN